MEPEQVDPRAAQEMMILDSLPKRLQRFADRESRYGVSAGELLLFYQRFNWDVDATLQFFRNAENNLTAAIRADLVKFGPQVARSIRRAA